MADEKLTKKAYKIANIYEQANLYFITTLAEQVADIENGDFDIMEQQLQTQVNLNLIKKEFKKAGSKTVKQTNALITKEGRKAYKEMAKFYKAQNVVQLPFNKNRRILNQLVAIEKITNGSFKNLSNTSAIDVRYKRCIDKAIMAVHSGASNYQDAINQAIREATKLGPKVEYAGGRSRRIDTAVRMNVLDGVRQMQIQVDKITGEEFGADAIEIDAHGLCAKDHQDIQGRIFTPKQYQKWVVERKGIRQIGTNNCQHRIKPIVKGVSKPTYTQEQLEEMRKFTEEPIKELGGMNRRDASNKMRQLETRVREDKEQLTQAQTRFNKTKSSKDKKEVERYERKINKTQNGYKELCKKADLKPQWYRMDIQ